MIRFGILGMGIRGDMYAQGLGQNRDAELVGISDINPNTLNTASDKWGVPGYPDFGDLISEGRPDAVIICTPDFAHCSPALQTAAAGIHMMIEKPLATTSAEAAKIVEAVQTNQVICQVAFENRWNPPFVQIKRAVENGDLGSISLVNAKLNDTLWVPTEMIPWAGASSVGWFLLPHVLDLAIWLSGKTPKKVYAVANKTVLPTLGIDTYDTICTTVSFSDGMQAVFENTWVLPNPPGSLRIPLNILGDGGAMQVNSHEQMVHQFTDRFSYPGSLFLDVHGQVRGFPLYMLDSFIECLLDGKTPLATVEEGYLVTRVVEAVHQSIAIGQPVDL